MISARVIALFVALITATTAAHGSVPIVVETGAGRRAVMKLCSDASDQLKNGDVASAKLRASINVRLGKYAEASKEFNYLVSIHPRRVTFARALSERAWFHSTCQNSSFRNGQQAVKDAKAACSIMVWKDEHMIDTLAAAYAETGDFDSAIRYAEQALAVKGISPESAKAFREHLMWFQQRRRFPASNKTEKI